MGITIEPILRVCLESHLVTGIGVITRLIITSLVITVSSNYIDLFGCHSVIAL